MFPVQGAFQPHGGQQLPNGMRLPQLHFHVLIVTPSIYYTKRGHLSPGVCVHKCLHHTCINEHSDVVRRTAREVDVDMEVMKIPRVSKVGSESGRSSASCSSFRALPSFLLSTTFYGDRAPRGTPLSTSIQTSRRLYAEADVKPSRLAKYCLQRQRHVHQVNMKAFPDDATGLAPPQSTPIKRISTASSQRLHDIMNEPSSPAAPLTPPIPPKSMLRESASMNAIPPQSATSSTWPINARPSESTQRTGPPEYDWVPSPIGGEDDNLSNGPVEGEKLAALRQSGGFQRKQRDRGGWGRLCLVIGLVALVVIGLAVGLGVGLTVGRRHKNNDSGNGAPTAPAADNGTETQSFPVGQHSIITALRTVDTGCTSNPNTWTCVPNTVYNPQDSATFTASQSEFHWVISNSSSTFATNGSDTTPDAGVPANLTISSTSNPLSIVFSDKPLTYINPSSNSSAERYTFSFSMAKTVIPTIDISGTNTQSQCFFNETTFTGTLYLSEPRTYPDNSTTTSSDAGDAEWPYAIEITQSSPGGQTGGQIIPACYSYINGVDGGLIDAGLSAQSADSQCECGYRNF